MLSDPNTIMGLGDGGAHVGFILDAGYPTWLLSYWTRDKKLFSLENSIFFENRHYIRKSMPMTRFFRSKKYVGAIHRHFSTVHRSARSGEASSRLLGRGTACIVI